MNKQNAIEKSLNIMHIFTKAPHAFTAKEISDSLGISKPTVHRILNTLKENNYVKQNVFTGKYSVGYGCYIVGMQYARNLDIYSELRRILDRISSETGTQVGYTVLENLDVVSVYESISYSKSIQYIPGEVYTINCGVYGKVLMAYTHSLDELEHLVYEIELKPVKPLAITNPKELLDEYKAVLEQGYAISYGEAIEGTIGIGVPVFNPDGSIHGCIGLSAIDTPSFREKMGECTQELLKGAREIANFLI